MEQKIEEELIYLIDEEFEYYLNLLELEEDKSIDEKYFAKEAKESIEDRYGKDKFDAFNIESYAIDYVKSEIEGRINEAEICL